MQIEMPSNANQGVAFLPESTSEVASLPFSTSEVASLPESTSGVAFLPEKPNAIVPMPKLIRKLLRVIRGSQKPAARKLPIEEHRQHFFLQDSATALASHAASITGNVLQEAAAPATRFSDHAYAALSSDNDDDIQNEDDGQHYIWQGYAQEEITVVSTEMETSDVSASSITRKIVLPVQQNILRRDDSILRPSKFVRGLGNGKIFKRKMIEVHHLFDFSIFYVFPFLSANEVAIKRPE
jgi:hypothetical protein